MKRMKTTHHIPAFVIGLFSTLLLTMTACTEDDHYSTQASHRLSFSTDTIAFDTLFTTVSSSTYTFLVRNRNKEVVRIDDIHLGGASSSPFRINVDGFSGTDGFPTMDIRGKDSMYVFVEVTVDPTGMDEPVAIRDSLIFTLGSGVQQQVQLRAYGQDATLLPGLVVRADTTLTAQKPYLVTDSLRVEPGCTLTLEPGTRLFFRDKVSLLVHGTLHAEGTVEQPVVFRGARTDHMFDYLPYDRLTGQWGGIRLYPTSTGNRFIQCDIHSGTYGIHAEGTDTTQVHLTMQGSSIHNVDADGLYLRSCRADISNSLFTNTGGHCVHLLGGKVNFLHCTLANFFPWKADRGWALYLSNTEDKDDHQEVVPMYGIHFVNCIITGSRDDELMGSLTEKTDTADYTAEAQYSFTSSLLNTVPASDDDPHYTHIVWDSRDSLYYGRDHFRTIDHQNFYYDFHLDSISPARGIASREAAQALPLDRDGVHRTDSLHIDAGCYQYVSPVKP